MKELLKGWDRLTGFSHVDYSRCGQRMFRDWSAHQCGNKAKYDVIEEHGKPTRCGVHCKAADKRRREQAAKRKREDDERRRRPLTYRAAREAALEAIRKIAAGHNDPRALAMEVLKPLEEFENETQS